MKKNKSKYRHLKIDKEKQKRKVKIATLFEIIFLILIMISVIYIIKWAKENNKNKDLQKELESYIIPNDTTNSISNTKANKIDFEALKEKNSDTVGWINLKNTNIQFPVVQAKSNDFYLTHSFDKSYNSAGWIFMDYRNSLDSQNIVIYGHNRRDGTMFAQMLNCLKPQWYENKDNQNVEFITTDNTNYTYKIFSIYKVEKEDYYIQTEFKENKTYENFLKTIKERSIKNFEVNININNQILTLSTCANDSKYRVVIHAVKVENN